MMVIGTPRPSSGVFGEIRDNGFFESPESADFRSKSEGSEEQDAVEDSNNDEGGAGRNARSRSESFHEKFTDEGDKAVGEVQMIGKTPLMAKQLAIVTVFDSHRPQDGPEVSEEQQLEALEAVSLQAWMGPGGRGKADPGGTNNGGKRGAGPWSRRRSSLSKTLVIHSGLSTPLPEPSMLPRHIVQADASHHVEFALLPPFEDKISVAVLGSAEANVHLDWSSADFIVVNRRVSCQIWTVPDSLAQEFVKTCDACIVEWTPSDPGRAERLLQLAEGDNRVLACRGKGKPTPAAKAAMQACPQSIVWLEQRQPLDAIVCQSIINLAKKRGDEAAVIGALTAHLKKLKPGSCVIM